MAMLNNQRVCAGWWLIYPSEKYESVGMMTFPIYGTIKNVPNHQPVWKTGRNI